MVVLTDVLETDRHAMKRPLELLCAPHVVVKSLSLLAGFLEQYYVNRPSPGANDKSPDRRTIISMAVNECGGKGSKSAKRLGVYSGRRLLG